MRLISCDTCAVVIDTDKIRFPDVLQSDGTVDMDKAVWNMGTYHAFVPCPVCGSKIVGDWL